MLFHSAGLKFKNRSNSASPQCFPLLPKLGFHIRVSVFLCWHCLPFFICRFVLLLCVFFCSARVVFGLSFPVFFCFLFCSAGTAFYFALYLKCAFDLSILFQCSSSYGFEKVFLFSFIFFCIWLSFCSSNFVFTLLCACSFPHLI